MQDLKRCSMSPRHRSARAIGILGLYAVSLAGIGLFAAPAASAEHESERTSDVETRILENGTIVRKTSKFEVRITPIRDQELSPVEIDPRSDEGQIMAGTGCPTLTKTYSDVDFEGTNVAITLQAGFVETEIAAAQHFVDADQFPVRVDMMEKLFGTINASVTTTTEWSVMIWAGPPNTGDLIDVFSSDDVILPHLVIPPGTNGVNVQVIVDPSDPEPIIVPANSSNSLTIGYRIDSHHNPPTSSCDCPLFGTMPAVCCPPSTSSNAFPSTDPSGLTNAAGNWIFARDCPGTDIFCGVAPAGWYNFTTQGLPSGDWNIRVTYTGLNCPEEFGACCFGLTNCQILSATECANQGGMYQGDNVNCTDVQCEPFGACCILEGGDIAGCEIATIPECDQLGGLYQGDAAACDQCSALLGACCTGEECQVVLENVCDDNGGNWLGQGTQCTPDACVAPVGACCVEATGACVEFDEETCDAVSGIWQGPGTSCLGFVCFPIGSCCLPDGSCIDDVAPEECEDQDGAFSGDGSTCETTDCPAPVGACCLANGNCFVFSEAVCADVAGEWAGFGTNCSDDSGSGTADICEDQPDPCPGDLNADDEVNVLDLLLLLEQWGTCSDPDNCPADLNSDEQVNVLDLLILLEQWGSCP